MTEVFDREAARAIAGGARTLHERLADPDAVVAGDRDDEAVERVLGAWRDRFPSEAAFRRRLDRDGLTEADCRAAIRADRLAGDEPLPAWVERLDAVVAAVLGGDPGDQPDRLGPAADDRERRFGPLTAAIAAHARDRLPDDPVREVLPEPVVGTMAEWLRARFESRFTRLLYVEFKASVAAHDRELAHADPDDFEDPPTEVYEAFLGYLFDGGFAELCVEYPVFARLLVTQLDQFDAHVRELPRRLDADRDAIAERFGDGDLGPVTDVEPLADDTHGGGRAVMRVTFASGVSVAYKPRSVDAGEAFYGLLDDLDDHLPTPEFDPPTYLARDGYGWMEWVDHEDCEDAAAVERYYRRAGALVAVAYLLEFSDCQVENVVVAGEQPTPVDVETVLHPYFDPSRTPTGTGTAALTDDTVLLTALLPYGVRNVHADGGYGATVATAGLGHAGGTAELDELQLPRVRAVNTDVMAVEEVPARIDRSDNLPSVDGEPVPPGEHVDALVSGFEAAYGAVLDLRDADRLGEVGLPDALAGVENRVVYRPTNRYAKVLQTVCSRSGLRDGARFGVGVEELAARLAREEFAEPRPWALFDAERRAVKRLDPPRFTCRTDGTELRLDGEPIGVEADAAGVDRARRRVEAASRADLREQVELLRGAFGHPPSPDPEPDPSAGRRPVADDELRAEARALLDRVEDAALETVDGTPHWTSVQPVTGPGVEAGEPFDLQPADGALYTGRTGIALLGAGLYRVTGEDRYRAFALDAVGPVRDAVRGDRETAALASLGGTGGVGAVTYGLGVLGDLLDEADLVDEAVAAADALTDDLVAGDDTHDVVGGAAGTVLGLLGLHDRRAEPELVSLAADCGDHLLRSRVETEGGARAWRTLSDHPPLAGFAHGAAGIAYALARLADATGDDRYRDAALEAVSFEDGAYSESAENWADRRTFAGPDAYPDQWCHGRSGVGLARLGTAAHVAADPVERDVERAVAGFPESGLGDADHLCCGDAGRVEFLLEAAARRGRLAGEARRLVGGVLGRKRDAGSYRRLAQTDAVTDPTLFLGLAGIGYAMLRVTAPEELPCLLLWE